MKQLNAGLILGLVCLLCSGILVFIWIPLDTETGIIERMRSRQVIGDALAPTIAGAILGLSGLLLCLEAWGRHTAETLKRDNILYLLKLLVIISLSIALMRWLGPWLVSIFAISEQDAGYRELRDTMPWKYLGYISGGGFLVFSLVVLIEHRFRWRTLALAFIITLLIALIYDLPFDDLLLPPNGDV